MWWQRNRQQQSQQQPQGGLQPPPNLTPPLLQEREPAMPYGQLYNSIMRNGFGSNFGFVNYHADPTPAQQAFNSPLYNSLMRGG